MTDKLSERSEQRGGGYKGHSETLRFFIPTGFIQIFKKLFREILCTFDLFEDNLAHFSLGFLIFTKNKKLLRNFLG